MSLVVLVADRGLAAWLRSYAVRRGVPVSVVVAAALREFRADAQTGVPDLEG